MIMKRFINLLDQDVCYRFAWYDTITDTFEEHSDSQTWDTWAEFKEDYEGKDLPRYKVLCPKWVFEKVNGDE